MSAKAQAAAQQYPVFVENLPDEPLAAGRYAVRFARSAGELRALQRLRFEVFNLEMGEGLDASYATGLDEDRFDPVCHHLIVIETDSQEIIGTYRMQTTAMARRHHGFYSAEEFDLGGLPDEMLGQAVEVGRACVAKPYRNRHVLFLLWRGLAAYIKRNHKKYLFGCCSLTSQDPVEGLRVMRYLESEGHVHPVLRIAPQPGWNCYGPDVRVPAPTAAEPVRLPKLFSLYLRYGAKVCGPPALDRHFKTIDYLVILNVDDLGREARDMFLG